MSTDDFDWHDLYEGRGADAVYLGSFQTAYPPADLIVDHGVLQHPNASPASVDELHTRWTRSVRRMMNAHAGVREWPHRYATSAESAWSWHWDGAGLYVYREGTPYLVATPVAKRVSGTAFPVVAR